MALTPSKNDRLAVGLTLTPEEAAQLERLKILTGKKKNAGAIMVCFEVVMESIKKYGTVEGVKPQRIRSQMDIWREQDRQKRVQP